LFGNSKHHFFKGVPINSSLKINQATAFEKENQIPLFFSKINQFLENFLQIPQGFHRNKRPLKRLLRDESVFVPQ